VGRGSGFDMRGYWPGEGAWGFLGGGGPMEGCECKFLTCCIWTHGF